MTDKQKELLDEMTKISQEYGLYEEQIIIDNIDVSGCENFRPDADTSEISYTNACSIGLWQRWYSDLEPSCTMSCRCRDNLNCHYKLYKRKEQKLNKIKDYVDRCLGDADRFYIFQIIEGKENG